MPSHSVEELRIMRYWYAATVIGKMVMVAVLLALTGGINMKCSQLENVTNLSQLQPTSALSNIWIHLFGVDDDDCHDIGILMQRFSAGWRGVGRMDLFLRYGNITGCGAITLLKCLCEHKVTCTKIWVYSSQVPNEDQQEEMKNLARHCIKSVIEWKSGGVYLYIVPNIEKISKLI
ncbi:unnamed protein product [Meganyctiphanes norvegica]|uniref:Uncharacterized protein n=1 Tax=Meganyctiphanes norvegica TaxID=48144 RepID=A0AAV2SB68_MEGNR